MWVAEGIVGMLLLEWLWWIVEGGWLLREWERGVLVGLGMGEIGRARRVGHVVDCTVAPAQGATQSMECARNDLLKLPLPRRTCLNRRNRTNTSVALYSMLLVADLRCGSMTVWLYSTIRVTARAGELLFRVRSGAAALNKRRCGHNGRRDHA